MSLPNRIDVHQHVVPPFWAKALPTHGGDPSGTVIPEWSPESAIDFMDSLEIATGILSLTAPGVVHWTDGEAIWTCAYVESISAMAAPGATFLLYGFARPPRLAPIQAGVRLDEVRERFSGQLIARLSYGACGRGDAHSSETVDGPPAVF